MTPLWSMPDFKLLIILYILFHLPCKFSLFTYYSCYANIKKALNILQWCTEWHQSNHIYSKYLQRESFQPSWAARPQLCPHHHKQRNSLQKLNLERKLTHQAFVTVILQLFCFSAIAAASIHLAVGFLDYSPFIINIFFLHRSLWWFINPSVDSLKIWSMMLHEMSFFIHFRRFGN